MAQMSTQLVEAATRGSLISGMDSVGGSAVGAVVQGNQTSQANGNVASPATAGIAVAAAASATATGALHTATAQSPLETQQKPDKSSQSHAHTEDDNDEDADGVVTQHTHQFESLSVPVFSGGLTDLASTEVCVCSDEWFQLK
jgi:hypothetical protein